MTSENPTSRPADAFVEWIRALVPDGCTPVGWCHKAIHRHIVEKAPDVIDATKGAISQSFGDTPHVVLEIHADDEAIGANPDLEQALSRTDGGVLLLGVGYERD